MQKTQKAWLMAAGFAGAILAVSSIPAHSMPRAPELWRWDKLIHALEYALATTLFYRALELSRPARDRRSLIFRVLLCVLLYSGFGVLDELYQSTVPGRDSSVYDVMADILGACFASIGSAVFYSRRVDHS
jgi:VanZ family protein